MSELQITGNPAADALLATNDDALLLGMLLDQQIPMEKAFSGPYVLAERLDGIDLTRWAAMDVDEFVAVCATPPAVHRFPGSMGKRLHELCVVLADEYDGHAANVWQGVDSGAELKQRLTSLPGFGDQKASIFVALLAKRRGVRPAGWQQAAGDYGLDGYRSVADITDADSLAQVRATKKAVKAAAKAAKAE